MARKRRSFMPGVQVGGGGSDDRWGLSVAQAARDLGISEAFWGAGRGSLWKIQPRPSRAKGRLKPQDEELARLRRENEVFTPGARHIKKSSGHLLAGAQVR